ncbi:hypothetical protein [Pontibacter pamirensis]|nr:hypothetical protein [Pontibacter pamirensis]
MVIGNLNYELAGEGNWPLITKGKEHTIFENILEARDEKSQRSGEK